MSRSWREGVGAALAALLIAGCAGVPTSGPVREHDSGDEQVNSSVNVAPVPPADGASAMLMVEGFLHAMGTDQPGYPVARQYLTEAASRAWLPEAGTSIYAAGYQPRETEASTAEQPAIILEAVLTGTLSPAGEYREGSGGMRHDFGLVRTAGGQWRISKPPKGLLISRYQFTTNYVGLDLNFLDLTGDALVPEPRFFPPAAVTLTALAGAQVAGPGEWLAPAVRPAQRVRVVVDQAELSPQGVATLHLEGAGLPVSDADRRTLMAELTTTLAQLPQVVGVQIMVGATLLPLPGTTTTTFTADDFEDLDPTGPLATPRLVTVRENQVRLVESPQPWTEGEAIAPALVEPGAITTSADLSQVASVSPDRTRLSVAGRAAEEATVLLTGEGLIRPDFSRQGELWALAGSGAAGGFTVFTGPERARLPVAVSGVPEQPVRAFRISPDGTRMALVLEADEVEQVGVARIVRSADGLRLEDFRPVTVSPPAGADRRILDVGWTTGTEMLVLVSHGTTTSVVRVDQDSSSADDIGPAEVAGLRELAVAPRGQAVLRGEGAVFRYEGPLSWRLTARAVEAISYSG